MRELNRFGRPNLMTLSEIAEVLRPWSKPSEYALVVCERSGLFTPVQTLFPHLAPPGESGNQYHWASSIIEQQKYAKAVRSLSNLAGDFKALETGGRARVFVNHTWSEPDFVFFERGGIASAALMTSDNVLRVFKLFRHADVNQPHVQKALELGARYMQRYAI